jgi:RNA polymerase sigma factor (sigma-70 family)
MPSPTRSSVTRTTRTPSTTRPTPDARLDTPRAFDRCVVRVTPRAFRWMHWWRVPKPDDEDVVQETFTAMWRRRESYNPARGSWEEWAYGFAWFAVLEYRRKRHKLAQREQLTDLDLPESLLATANLEGTIYMVRLLYKLIEELPIDLSALFLAREVDDISWETLAVTHGISVSTAHARHKEARDRLLRGLDRDQEQKRASGVAVLPLTLVQLVAAERSVDEDVPESTMRKLRAALENLGAGKPSLGSRTLRAILGRRGRSALTHAITAAAGAGVTYAVMADNGSGQAHNGATLATAASADSTAEVADVRLSDAPPSSAPGPGPLAATREHASLESSASARDSAAAETALFDQASAAYEERRWDDAIKGFQDHGHRFPVGAHSAARERLLTLALIAAHRTTEAHQRIEALRRMNPKSPLLREFDARLPPEP